MGKFFYHVFVYMKILTELRSLSKSGI